MGCLKDSTSHTQSYDVHCVYHSTMVEHDYCRAGSEATNRAAMSFLYVYIYYNAVTLGSARAYGRKYEL